jgi:hypothetical protein
MKLRLEESLEQSLARLEKRTEKPSFDNNKGLTKIERYIILDSIDYISRVLDVGEGNSLAFSPNSDE